MLGLLKVSADDARTLYGDPDHKGLNNSLYVDLFLGSQRYLARHHAASGKPTFVLL